MLGVPMDRTELITQIVGPVLLLRSLSIVIDREHFVEMVNGLEKEIRTVPFSLFPIALLMTCIALALVHSDSSSPAALLIHVIAWGGMIKAAGLILFPTAVVAKARLLVHAGFLNVVLVVCFAVGAYF